MKLYSFAISTSKGYFKNFNIDIQKLPSTQKNHDILFSNTIDVDSSLIVCGTYTGSEMMEKMTMANSFDE